MKARDEAEFTEFAAITIRRLRRTAYLMCGDWHRAEDAAQDALVKVYRHWNRIEPHRQPDRLRPSLRRHRGPRPVQEAVAPRASRRHRRATCRPLPDTVGSVDDRLLVIEALHHLSPSQRACVVLRHYADLSLEQTADILGISVGGVKSQTSRGLGRLRELLDQTERSAS